MQAKVRVIALLRLSIISHGLHQETEKRRRSNFQISPKALSFEPTRMRHPLGFRAHSWSLKQQLTKQSANSQTPLEHVIVSHDLHQQRQLDLEVFR